MVNSPATSANVEQATSASKTYKRPRISIRWTLPLFIVTPLVAGIGLTGWLAFRSGQSAVEELVSNLSEEVAGQIEKEVTNYLDRSAIISEVMLAEFQSDNISAESTQALSIDFWYLTKSPQLSNNVFYGNELGEFVYVAKPEGQEQSRIDIRDASNNFYRHEYDINANQQLTQKRLVDPEYDPRKRRWYEQAKDQQQSVWSDVYPAKSSDELTITRATPILINDQFEGVLGIDVYLSELSDFLRKLDMSKDSRAFIIEPSGDLIATSDETPPFIITNGEKSRLPVINSQDPLIQATANNLIERVGDFNQINEQYNFIFNHKQNKQLAYVYRPSALGVDWLIVVAIPQADYMGTINASARRTMFIGFGISGIASLMGLAVALWIVRPIQRIHHAARAIKANTFKEETLKPVIARPDEFGQLAELFNDMAIVVVSREQSLAEQVETLRSEIDQYGESGNGRLGQRTNYKALIKRSQSMREALKK